MSALRAKLRDAIRAEPTPVIASDADPAMIELVRQNARRARVEIAIEKLALGELRRSGPGAIVGNPPYGHRLRAAPELGRELARLVDRHQERHIALLMASEQPFGRTHRRPEPPRLVFNGDIECVVRLYAPRAT
jgi:23S rRNA G2445 N2-methylase RlmL